MTISHWGELVNPLIEKAANPQTGETLESFVESEYASRTIYPEKKNILASLYGVSPNNVKAVILGQDPYIKKGQAMGFSFAVPIGMALPPSLRNIYAEMESDVGVKRGTDGCLAKLAEQGVLLLNAVLTVRANESNSHAGCGWESVTDGIIAYLAQRQEPTAFILWGRSAKDKLSNVSIGGQHLILASPHPSPYSASSGFFGCRHFSKTNDFLTRNGIAPIDWSHK